MEGEECEFLLRGYFYLHGLPFTGTGGQAEATGKSKKEAKKDGKKEVKKPISNSAPSDADEISKVELIVGQILSCRKHPDADSLYVEEIDVGEATPRTICSGLVKFVPQDKMITSCIVMANLKPVKMRGIASAGMVMCASNADKSKVELLVPPAGAKPGDRVVLKGYNEGIEPEKQMNPKKKTVEKVSPFFKTSDELLAMYKDAVWMTPAGPVKASSIVGGSIS
eukprot:Rmarinus@m.11487